MRRKIVPAAVAVLLFMATPVLAQVEAEFSGYIVDLPMYQRFDESLLSRLSALAPRPGGYDEGMAVNLTRLRLRPTLRLWEGASVSLEHEVDLLFSSGNMPFGRPVERSNRQAATLRWQPIEEDNVSLQHYVDRLYFRQNFIWGSVIAGRQRIQWGTGRIWNPTDLFNPINPASFDQLEKEGADAISAKLYLGSFTDVQAVVNFRSARGQREGAPAAPDSTNYGIRFRTNYLEFDVSAIGGWFDRRVVFGGDFAGNLFEAGVRGEAVYFTEGEDMPNSDYLRLVIGADYQFTPEFYGLIEYLYSGEGNTDPGDYAGDLPRLFRGDILHLNTKYLYAGGTYLLHPLVNATAGLLQNIGDGSGFVSLAANWSSSENTALTAGLLLPYGDNGDEYWYYPMSLYLKGEWHF
ncbi:MAG: hypothetical protein KFF77_12085 [Bacteroidetes bacterium]|nr:hypothetical protein [Bacteroidota bacterium]